MCPDDVEPDDEQAMFERFGALRRRVVRAVEGFEGRLRERVDRHEPIRVSLADAALSAVAELLNVVSRWAGEGKDDER